MNKNDLIKLIPIGDIPEGCELRENGEYYYQWETAMMIAKKQGLRLLTKDEWEQLIKNKYPEDLGLKLVDYEGGRGSFNIKGCYSEYWTSNEYNSLYAWSTELCSIGRKISYHRKECYMLAYCFKS